MLISVVVTTYRRARELSLCLEGLRRQSFPKQEFEVIVVDNACLNETRTLVQDARNKSFDNVVYMESNTNRPGLARNTGAALAKAEIVGFIDDDCVADKDWLKNINNFFERNKQADAVLGNISALNNKNIIAVACKADFDFIVSSKIDAYSKRINFLCGGNIAFRKKSFLELGGFSSFARAEESLFLYKLMAKDKAIFYEEKIKVKHIFTGSPSLFIKKSFLSGFFIYKSIREYGKDFKSILYKRKILSFLSEMKSLFVSCLKAYHIKGLFIFKIILARRMVTYLGMLASKTGIKTEEIIS